ncbi:MAG: Fic/DOC family protein [Alphaproteobacteria bacterium]
MTDDPYVYPGTSILRNRLGLTDAAALARLERRLVTQRLREGAPAGTFDFDHLRAIHRHLFQDIFDWAGEPRTVEIAKGGQQFQLRRFLANGMADVRRRLRASGYLRGRSQEDFAAAAGEIIGDVNFLHPFRDGNGRTQLLYLQQLADGAGHTFDLTLLHREAWISACRRSHLGDNAALAACIVAAIRS